jgi:WD40 repeat protein
MANGTVKLYDTEALQLRRQIKGAPEPRALAYSPDGRLLAVATQNVILLLDPETGDQRGELDAHTKAVHAVTFTPDSKTLLSAALDGTVRRWDVLARTETGRAVGLDLPLTGVRLSPDGRLASWYAGVNHVWDVASRRELGRFPGQVCFVPQSDLVLVASDDGSVALWDVTTNQKRGNTFPHRRELPMTAVAFSADGQTYVLSGAGLLKVTRLAKLLAPPQERPSRPELPLGSVTTGELRRFELAPVFPNTQGVTCVAFAPDGRRAVMGSTDNCLRVGDVETGQAISTLVWKERQVPGPLTDVCFLPGGRQLLTGTPDGFRLWDVGLGREVPRFNAEFNAAGVLPIAALAFSADGRRGLTRTGPTLRLWDIDAGRVTRALASSSAANDGLALSADGQRALDGLTLRNLTALQTVWQLDDPTTPVGRAAFLPGSKRALTLAPDGALRLWDLEKGQELRRLRDAAAQCVAISPDGRLAATGGNDHTLRLWELETGRELHRFTGHAGEVFSVAFAPDGKRLLSGSSDRTMRLWKLPDNLVPAP